MARRMMMSTLGRWSTRVFAVELDARSDPVYFALSDSHRDEVQLFKGVRFRDQLCYSLHVYSTDRILREKCYGGLRDKLSKALPPECEIFGMFSFQPDVKDSLVKGYFIVLKDPSKYGATQVVLCKMLRDDPVHVCMYWHGEYARQWLQYVWSHEDDGKMEMTDRTCLVPSEAVSRNCMVPADPPEYHPSALNIVNSDVFYSFEEAYKVLQECGDIIPESRAVLKLVDQRLPSAGEAACPVIVIEGLDATGKTTLTESLKESLGAGLLRSPPQCLSPWRALFDAEPPLIRRAFYALGNYITAGLIRQAASQTPVIVDRYWHSTAAYAMATAVGGQVGNLPGAGSEVYRWPADLPRPSLVVLLTLSPEERQHRLRVRGQEKTQEEEQLEADALFRQKVEEAYRRVEGPACVSVDASPPPDQVLHEVLLLIRDKCHL